jgi:hypothetical protein
MRRIVLLGILFGLLTAGGGVAHAEPSVFNPGVIAAYSLAAPTPEAASGIIARAVIPKGAACPNIVVSLPSTNGPRQDEVVMYGRNLPATTSPAFDSITVCQARIPLHAIDASIMGHPIPAHMPSRIRRLAMFGDSGCRIWPIPDLVQDCADREAWPLADIAESIVEQQPDAVIFNGDFFYREAACPEASQAQCGSSPPPITGLPMTDSAYGWIADVLLPMAPLLSQAPLIVTRGNHETCNRAGNGYFLLFDPRRDTVGTCAPISGAAGLTAPATTPTATYAIDLSVAPGRTLRLAIVDSAGGSDTTADGYAASQRPAYEAAAALTARRAGRESWLVTHRPSYGYVSNTNATPGVPFNPWTSVDQTAASFGLLGTYDLVFSAHMHLAQSVQIPGSPGQLVLGNGGTMLDPAIGYPLPGQGPVGAAGEQYPAPTSAWVSARFGYAMAYPRAQGGAWRVEMMDPAGSVFGTCGVADRRIRCADAPASSPR